MDRLYSEDTGTLTGAHDVIMFYHGLRESTSGKVAPDQIDLEITQSSEAAGAGAAAVSTKAFAGVATALQDVIIGGGTYDETWVFAAARTNPFTVAVGTTAAESAENLIAAINADTIQNLVADESVAGTCRVRAAAYPGGDTEAGVRDFSAFAGTAGGAWSASGAAEGSGNVAGAVSWSVLASTSDFVKLRLRGLESTDSVTYRIRTWRLHSMMRSVTSQLVTGADGDTTIGSNDFTPTASPLFVTNGVLPGHILVIMEPDTGGFGDCLDNGSYEIENVTETTLTLTAADLPDGWKQTDTLVNFAVGFGTVLQETEAGINQAPFGLPGDDVHTAAAPCTDVDVPGEAIETAEIKAGALAATSAGRAIMATDYFDASTLLAKVAADALGTTTLALFADGELTPVKLTIDPVADVDDYSKGWIRFVGTNVADTETVVINARTYQFNTAGGGPGDVPIDMTAHGAAPWLASDCADELIAAINNDITRSTEAVAGADGNSVLLAGYDDLTALTLVSTCTAAVVSAATLQVGVAGADSYQASGTYAVTAADVTKWAVGVTEEILAGVVLGIGVVPVLSDFRVMVLALGLRTFKTIATLGYRIVQINANNYGLLVRDPAALLADGDEIQWTLKG